MVKGIIGLHPLGAIVTLDRAFPLDALPKLLKAKKGAVLEAVRSSEELLHHAYLSPPLPKAPRSARGPSWFTPGGRTWYLSPAGALGLAKALHADPAPIRAALKAR